MKKIRLIIINYAVLVTILATIEIIGHVTYRIFKGKFLFETKSNSQTLFKTHPYLVGVPKKNSQITNLSKTIKISTNANGNRITKNYIPDSNAIKIICIGGSTTFGTGITDRDSWPYMLQDLLGKKYNVINMGVPGYTTLEGIIQLSTIIPEIKPDMILIYQGWNDLRNYHITQKTPDYRWHGNTQKNNLSVAPKDSILEYSFLYFLVKKMTTKLGENSKLITDLQTNTDSYQDSIYVRNLKTLQSLSNHFQIKQIFIPQVLNLEEYITNEKQTDPWTPNIQNKNIPHYISHINTLMYDHITQDSTTIIIDSIMTKYNWDTEDFVDYGHFSKKGGQQFSSIIHNYIQKGFKKK